MGSHRSGRRDTSVSRLLGELLKERMTAQSAYENAMERALARKPFLAQRWTLPDAR